MMINKENYLGDTGYINELETTFRFTIKDYYKPEESALLVIDMQDYFILPDSHAFVPASREIIQRIERIQNEYLKKGLKVFQTRHLNTPGMAGNMETWWNELLTRDHSHSKIFKKIQNQEIPVIEKGQYDAFYNTDLKESLLTAGISQVVICGLMAHLCCETTARRAFVEGFQVFFLYDLVASFHRQFHTASVQNLSHGFSNMISSRMLMDFLEVRK